MYMYIIMRRTQIYLSEEACEVLDREAVRTGRTRSQLIRDAIDSLYLHRKTPTNDVERILEETAGAWRRRGTSGADYVERLRGGRLAQLHEIDPSR